MSIAFKPRTQLNLPQENPLITAIKKRVAELRSEMSAMFSLFDARFRTEKQRIDEKLKEADRILSDARKVKDGHTPTEEELTELIQHYIPEVQDGHTPTEEELTALILQHMPEPVHGKTPTENELLALIYPLIPKVEHGKTPTDRELVRLIKPLIPKPIKPAPPIKGDPGINGTEIKPEEVKAKLKELPIKSPWFPAEHIIGLIDLIRNYSSVNLGGTRGGQGSWTDWELLGIGDGSNKTFTLSKPSASGGEIIVVGQAIQFSGVGGNYTISGLTVTFNTAPGLGVRVRAKYHNG